MHYLKVVQFSKRMMHKTIKETLRYLMVIFLLLLLFDTFLKDHISRVIDFRLFLVMILVAAAINLFTRDDVKRFIRKLRKKDKNVDDR